MVSFVTFLLYHPLYDSNVVLFYHEELFGGILSSPEIDKMDAMLLRQMRDNSRIMDDTYFAYYFEPAEGDPATFIT